MKNLLLALLLVAGSAQAAPPRVVVVQSDDLAPYVEPVPAFLTALGEPAIVINLHGQRSEAEALATRLKQQDPKVVFALGAKAAWAVKQALPHTPLLYASVLEPERYGLEGSQVTGVEMTVSSDTYLSQYVGFFPEHKRIGLLRGPSTSDEQLAEVQAAADASEVTLVVRSVTGPREVRRVASELAPLVDALWLRPDRAILTRDTFRGVVEETRRRRVPLLVETDNMVRAGGMFAVVPSAEGLGEQVAAMARRIADGAAPAVIPVEAPDRVLVVLNTRAVDASNVSFDRLLLDFVDVVVE